jgi:hypothetical protein
MWFLRGHPPDSLASLSIFHSSGVSPVDSTDINTKKAAYVSGTTARVADGCNSNRGDITVQPAIATRTSPELLRYLSSSAVRANYDALRDCHCRLPSCTLSRLPGCWRQGNLPGSSSAESRLHGTVVSSETCYTSRVMGLVSNNLKLDSANLVRRHCACPRALKLALSGLGWFDLYAGRWPSLRFEQDRALLVVI